MSPKMIEKQPKLKVIIHGFRRFRDPRIKCYEVPPRNMGGHKKGLSWLGTII